MLPPYLQLTSAPDLVTYKFRFQSAGTGTTDPDNIIPKNGITDIDQSAPGVFAITFAEKHPTLIGVTGSVMPVVAATGAGFGCIVQASVVDYVASTGVLTVRVVDPYTDATPRECSRLSPPGDA
jgi:hypothetical protein